MSLIDLVANFDSDPIPTEVAADAAMVRSALEDGGRAEVTVRSRATGKHVTLVFAAKKARPSGKGYLPRNTTEGRVGILDADRIDVTDAHAEFPENRVGGYVLKTGRFYADTDEAARRWAAEKVLAWALGDFDLDAKAEVFLATRCCVCAHKLTDPESVERMMGPDCFGARTGSQAVPLHA